MFNHHDFRHNSPPTYGSDIMYISEGQPPCDDSFYNLLVEEKRQGFLASSDITQYMALSIHFRGRSYVRIAARERMIFGTFSSTTVLPLLAANKQSLVALVGASHES
jgi:hypothetical protein